MKEFLDVINARKSVRNYAADKVSAEDLKTIAEAGIYAPNAMNKQEWHFTVVSDADLLGKMSEACRKGMAACPVPMLQKRAEDPDFNAFFRAPAVIVVTASEEKFSAFNAGCAVENICLAAQALGYGTCVTASTEFMFAGDPDLNKTLLIPEGYHFVCAVTLGKEAPGPDDHVRDRNKDVISYL